MVCLATYAEDDQGDKHWTDNLVSGFFGDITQNQDDCTELNTARLGLLALFEATKTNHGLSGYFENTTQVLNISSRTGTLNSALFGQMSNTVTAYTNTPTNTVFNNALVYYLSAEISEDDKDNYIGAFYNTHGSISNFATTTDANGDIFFDWYAIDPSSSNVYGYYPCQIKMQFDRQNVGLSFSAISQYLSIKAISTGSLSGVEGSEGSEKFQLTVLMNDGTLETITGESCFLIANCNSCTSPTPEVPTNCYNEVTAYNSILSQLGEESMSVSDYCEKYSRKNQLSEYSDYITTLDITSTSSPYYVSYDDFLLYNMKYYVGVYFDYLLSVTTATSHAGLAAVIPASNPPFELITPFAANKIGPGCVSDYATYYASYGYTHSIIDFGATYDPYEFCPLIDFWVPETVGIPEQNPCVEFYTNLATNLAQTNYTKYINGLKDEFKRNYTDFILQNSIETFDYTLNSSIATYHFTLYYYDQLGNLVKTIPPAGVAQGHTDPNTKPNHTLATRYRYNTLNQLISQSTPDGGTTNFWYDKLGRLIASQNAKQVASNLYSYTKYDALGRIEEVGQLTSTLTLTPTHLNDPTYPGNLATTREQVTRTYYDKAVLSAAETYYSGFSQQNLRNRVSASAYYPTMDETQSGYEQNYSHATHYSYDEHGNVKHPDTG